MILLSPPNQNIEAQGLHHLDGSEVTVTMGTFTYTAADQVGNDSYEITNWAKRSAGKSSLTYLSWIGSIVTSGKLDLDILFWESAPTTTSGDADAFDLSVANLSKLQGVVEIREPHWLTESGTADRWGQVQPNELGHEIRVAATSAYFSVIWRGANLAVTAGETLKFKFGNLYLDV